MSDNRYRYPDKACSKIWTPRHPSAHSPPRTAQRNTAGIFTLLRRDHSAILLMLRHAGSEASCRQKERLLVAATQEFLAHCQAEETTLYAALTTIEATRDFAAHSALEHKAMRTELGALANAHGDRGDSQALQKLVPSLIEHIEEEESELFPSASRFFSPEEDTHLGRAFVEARRRARSGEGGRRV